MCQEIGCTTRAYTSAHKDVHRTRHIRVQFTTGIQSHLASFAHWNPSFNMGEVLALDWSRPYLALRYSLTTLTRVSRKQKPQHAGSACLQYVYICLHIFTYSKTSSMKWLHPGILCGDFNLSKDPLINIGQKERKLEDATAVQQEFEGI